MQIQDMNNIYDFPGKFMYACILIVYMSKIHAYMKPRFNMNTYELARSLMEPFSSSGRMAEWLLLDAIQVWLAPDMQLMP
jgi:hypothetical protein